MSSTIDGSVDLVLAPARLRARALDDHVAGWHRRGSGGDLHSEHADTPTSSQSTSCRAGPGDRGHAADAAPARSTRRGGRGWRRRGPSPARRRRRRRPRRGAAAARGHVPVGILGLAARRRLADAGDDRVAGVAHLARLVAADARPDRAGAPDRSLATRSGSAIWARVISTPSQTPSPTAHSAWPQSTTEPCRNTVVSAQRRLDRRGRRRC